MNYIYDILLSFNEFYYDFYEWDNIIHIKKIPLIKISDKNMKKIYNNEVIINIDNILNKTELFDKTKIENACILYTSKFCMAIKLNKNGLVIERSSVLFDDIEDIILNKNKISKLDIKVLRPIKHQLILKENIKYCEFLNNKIDDLIKNNSYNELMYIYYECFNKKESNLKLIINELKENISNCNNNIFKMYEIFKLKK